MPTRGCSGDHRSTATGRRPQKKATSTAAESSHRNQTDTASRGDCLSAIGRAASPLLLARSSVSRSAVINAIAVGSYFKSLDHDETGSSTKRPDRRFKPKAAPNRHGAPGCWRTPLTSPDLVLTTDTLRLLTKSMPQHSAPRWRLVFVRPALHASLLRPDSRTSRLRHLKENPLIRATFNAQGQTSPVQRPKNSLQST